MAITVGTDTYVTLAAADAYMAANYISTDAELVAWNLLTDANKEVLLKKATKLIDRQLLVGIKAVSTQTLEFPRAIYSNPFSNLEVYDDISIYNYVNGYYVQTAVPQEVIDAQCEMAIYAVGGTSSRIELQRQGVSSFKVGNLSENYNGSSTKILSYEAKELLSPYLLGSANIC